MQKYNFEEISIYRMYLARTAQGEGFEDLVRVILAIMAFAGFLGGIIGGVMLDIVIPKLRGTR